MTRTGLVSGGRWRRSKVSRLVPHHSKGRRLRRLFAVLLVLACLHVAAMVYFEGLHPFDSLWLTLTTLTTVGYGDLSAATVPGRLSTMVLVFLGGIWTAFQSAALYFEYRLDRQERMRLGRWRWNMKDHILILNVPGDTSSHYLQRLISEFRASRRFRDSDVQVVMSHFDNGLPTRLSDLGAVHFDGDPWSQETLESVDADKADVIVVLAHVETDPESDSRSFDIIDRLREMGAEGRIIVECVDDRNRPRLKRAGADILVRPLRGYPEMVVRALAAPGAEAILEDMFTSRGDECWRYDVRVRGCSWIDLATLLLKNDIGLPIAYRNAPDGRMMINPKASVVIDADKLYVLVREGDARSDDEIAALLHSCGLSKS